MNLVDRVDAVIFDVDETLTGDISWFRITEGLGADVGKHARIFDRFKNAHIDYPTAKKQLLTLWSSTGNAHKSFMEDMFRSWRLRDGAHEILNYLKSRYKVCLISGAVDLHVQIVAEELGVDEWYANTRLHWGQDEALVDMDYYINQAEKKLEHFEEYKNKYAVDPQRCVAIGDGASDMVLFKELGYAIVIKSSKEYQFEGNIVAHLDSLLEIKNYL